MFKIASYTLHFSQLVLGDHRMETARRGRVWAGAGVTGGCSALGVYRRD